MENDKAGGAGMNPPTLGKDNSCVRGKILKDSQILQGPPHLLSRPRRKQNESKLLAKLPGVVGKGV